MDSGKRIIQMTDTAILAITESSYKKGKILSEKLENSILVDLRGRGVLKKWVDENFYNYSGHVFIMAAGIVLRVIAEKIDSKYTDPAVVAVDDAGRFSIALLSGHEGGANRLAAEVGRVINAVPVITTASDTNKKIVLGVGCRKNTSKEEIISAVKKSLEEENIMPEAVRTAASAEIKENEEGLIEAFKELDIPLVFISMDTIRNFCGYSSESSVARKHFDIPGVSEPCAILAGKRAVLIKKRSVYGNVTIAAAEEQL
jgi:cobalamin biosynthesis protein CbiG